MNIWHRLLHPWWRPTLLVLHVVGILVIVGCFVFDYSIAWTFPFLIINFVAVGMTWREAWVTSDPLVQPTMEREHGRGEKTPE